jgi:hypothetical protein
LLVCVFGGEVETDFYLMIRVGLIAAMLIGFDFSVQAQGAVDFRNSVQFVTATDRLVRDVSGTPLVGTNYLAQLYYGANPSSLNPVTDAPAPFRPATHSSPGTWTGGTRILWGFSPGQIVTLQVRVWDGTVAASYEDAAAIGFLATQHGVSNPFEFIPPSITSPASAWYIEEFRGFTLVPEPSVALLGMIGIVGLCFWRRGRP